MRPLPEHLSTQQDACKRLTRILAPLPGSLTAVWNRASRRYEVWAESREYGWAIVSAVQTPDGRECSPDVYPLYVLQDLRSRLERSDCKAILEQNAAAVDKRWRDEMNAMGETARFVAKAVAQEYDGTLRGGSLDVRTALRAARDGGTARRNAEERGTQIFVMGR